MLFYKAELEAGLVEAIQKNTSVSFVVQQTPLKKGFEAHISDEALASLEGFNTDIPETADLYYVQSILTSTGANANDDTFIPEQLWAARKTPVHKPTNIDHNQDKIIGHMTSQWAISSDGTIIPDDTPVDELPNDFHLCNGGVIYLHWKDEDFREEVDEVVASIEEGNKFVSMECLFKDFDYGVMNASGAMEVLPRNEETAFLTKHLRAYGGEGTFENRRLTRILKNYVFSGKGYVDNPANKRSIIFDKDAFTKANKTQSVYYVKANSTPEEKTNMSDVITSQLEETKALNRKLSEQVEALQKEISEVGKASFEAKIAELNAEIDALKEDAKAAKEAGDKVAETLACQCQKLEDSKSEKTELEKELSELKAKVVLAKRTNSLISAGLAESAEEAEETANSFASLDDDQWGFILKTLEAAKMTKMERKKEEEDKAKKAKANEAADLDDKNVDVEGDEASAGSVEPNGDEDADKKRKGSLQSAIAAHFHRDKKSDGGEK